MTKVNEDRLATQVVVIAATLLIIMNSIPVVAHSASNIAVEYDWDNQILSVIASHSVANPNSHYIWNITVYKNDVKVASRDYTSQGSTNIASDDFNIAAVDGDVFRVWAECNIGGALEATLMVVEPAATTTTTSGDTTTTPVDGTSTTPLDGTTTPPPVMGLDTLVLIGVIGFGIAAIVAAIVIRRR